MPLRVMSRRSRAHTHTNKHCQSIICVLKLALRHIVRSSMGAKGLTLWRLTSFSIVLQDVGERNFLFTVSVRESLNSEVDGYPAKVLAVD